MRKYNKYTVSVIIIAATIFLAIFINNNPPKSDRGRANKNAQMTVEITRIQSQNFQVDIESFGTVQPRTQSALVAQVPGQIIKVSPSFREGGFFDKGEVLIELDNRDYLAEQKIAQASLLSAKQLLLEEQARVEQALADWQRLGNGAQPSALVLREPQLAAAKAQVLSAQAQLQKADLALERSQIIAPYNGRILKQNVDFGQVVSANSQLADIYAIDNVEIRLPIKNKDLGLINLPEEFRNNNVVEQGAAVRLSSTLIGKQQWQGQIIRTEGAIDSDSQQLYIVAQIDDPFDITAEHSAPVKIGQYMTATIAGKHLQDVIVIPNSAIYQGSYVYLVEDNLLKRQAVEIRWQNNQQAIISSGLVNGSQLVLTSLGQVSSGTRVAIAGQAPTKSTPRDKSKAKRNAKAADAQGAKL